MASQVHYVYIINSELTDQRGKLTGLNLCEILNDIVPGQPIGSQQYNGVWTIMLRSAAAREHLINMKSITMDNVKIELFANYPTSKPVTNEKVLFKDLPFWVKDDTIIDFLGSQPDIIVKSGVISARLRDYNNNLTPFYSGDRFVFVRGKFSPALHQTALIEYNTCRVWHKSQELACKRCRMPGHTKEDIEMCKAFYHDQDIITIRSPKYVLCNYFMCHIKVYDNDFKSSEHAIQWRFLKYTGFDELANEVLLSDTPEEAKEIASRVPIHLRRDWNSLKLVAMRDILHAKADYCQQFRNELLNSAGKHLVESTRDLFWSSGLSPKDSSTTHPSYYPGRNQLGRVLELVRSELLNEVMLQKRLIGSGTPRFSAAANEPTRTTEQPPTDATNNAHESSQTLKPDYDTATSNTVHEEREHEVSSEAPSASQTVVSNDEILGRPDNSVGKSSIMSTSTTTDIDSDLDLTNGSDDVESEVTMSGIEELLNDTEEFSTTSRSHSDSEQPIDIIPPMNLTAPPKPPPRRFATRKQTKSVPQQRPIGTFFDVMKRKLTPGKESDCTRENVKVQKSDTDID